MHGIITREIEKIIFEKLLQYPIVAILGARQSGKTTFVKKIAENLGVFHYFNLNKWEDLERLYEPETVFNRDEDKAIYCLDNIQLAPELLSPIDRFLASEKKTQAKFLIAGTMSENSFLNALPNSRECVYILFLPPLTLKELYHPYDFSINRHWLRGGFPESYLATSDSNSINWRDGYLKNFIEHDCPKLGIQLSGMQTYRLLNTFANYQNNFLNTSKIADMFQLTHPTIRRYVEMLDKAYMMRLLYPYPFHTYKRIIKAPKIYIRDSGLLHRLLSIEDIHQLREHPVCSASWKGYMVENIISSLPDWACYFYEAASGYRLDLILMKGERKVAVKIHYSAHEITDNFWNGLYDIRPDFTFIIVASTSIQKAEENVTLCELSDFLDFMWREIELQPIKKKHSQ
ncbi:MAG: AAA family ATPase [Bacteroidales bacterium]|jgi:predicted AAA+ superfamily ATPase|nr:AAA family ATPase [Bacteroidales bacterium]